MLNAILFTFHEEFTPALNNPYFIVNQAAFDENNTKGFCEIRFEHEGVDYNIRRNIEQVSEHSHTSSIKFHQIRDNGSWVDQTQSYERVIKSIIPKAIAKYFFFDGEAAEAFFKNTEAQKKQNEIAIRDIIGVQFFDWAIEDYTNMKDTFEKQIRSIQSKNKGIQKIASEIESSKVEINKLELNLDGYDKKIDLYKQQIDELRKKQAGIKEIRKIAKERERIKSLLKQAKTKEMSLLGEQLSWVGQYAYSFFAEDLCKEKLKDFADKDKKAEIPEKYSRPWIEGLLEEEKCMCGRPFVKRLKKESLWKK